MKSFLLLVDFFNLFLIYLFILSYHTSYQKSTVFHMISQIHIFNLIFKVTIIDKLCLFKLIRAHTFFFFF